MSNNKKYYIYGALWTVVQLITSGGIMQTFFVEAGLSSRQIASFASLTNISQIVVMVLSTFLADKVRRVKDTVAVLLLSPTLLSLAMLPFCLWQSGETTAMYIMAMVFCFIQNLCVGFNSVLSFRLLYLIIDMKDYAGLANHNGIISNTFSLLVSSLITFLATRFLFRHIMAVGFIASVLFCVICAVCIKKMKEKREVEQKAKKNDFSLSKLGKKEFRYFYLPNFLRGIAAGGMMVISVVCTAEVTSDPAVISGLATILAVATILGCELYQRVKKRCTTAVVYAGASLLMFLFLPTMVAGGSVEVFCICYFLVSIGYGIINISGPVYATEIVGYQDIGTYTSVRLIVTTAGQAVASYGIGVAMDYVPAMVILGVCGLCQLISGIMYYRYDAK